MRLIGLSLLACLITAAPIFAGEMIIPLDKRPQWLADEGVVLAWSMEPLLFRVRRDGAHGYTPTAEQRAAYLSEYSPEMLARLKSLGVNLVMLHCYKGGGVEAERESMAEAVEFAKRIHKAGLRVAVYNYSGAFLWELLFKEKPEARDWVQIGSNGKPLTYGPATYRYYWYRNHPDAVEYYKKLVRFAVEDIGADLIHFDNYHRNTCLDPTSVQHFRQYLRTTFTPQQLAEDGIDPDTARPPTGTRPDNLLRRAHLDFRCKSLTDSYHDMVRYAHSLRRDVLVESNLMGVHPRIRPPVDRGRFLQAGEANWDESMNVGMKGGKLQTRIRFYKIARRNDNMGFNYTTTPLEMAESIAFNLDCVGAILEFEYGEVHDRRNRPVTKISPYVAFFRNRRELLHGAAVVADTAVLRSFPSLVFDQSKTALATYAVEKQFIENRACFQIIYDHQLDELDRYQAVVLAGCSAMSDKHIESIRRYVKRGGKLCVQGPLATHDEWMMPREKPALADLPAGQVVRFDSPADAMSALDTALDGKPSLRISAKQKLAKPQLHKLNLGHKFYSDRDYALLDAPKDLLGCRTIQVSHTATKDDSSLDIFAKTPIRVFAAFAPQDAETQWLKPQPGWKLYKRAALKTTMSSWGKVMDIHYKDLSDGETTLFAGKKGNYVPIAFKPLSNIPAEDDFTFSCENNMLAPLGLCAELTEQKNRRLVHLVNYRNDGPVEAVKVELHLPLGREAHSVTLSSPERKDDISISFEQKGSVINFTVPRVEVYEIAAVKWK